MKIYPERMTASRDEKFVVFLIGMRVNKWWKIHKWLPVSLAMTKMLKELYAQSEHGFISAESWFGRTPIMVQYWQSFEALERYAKNREHEHLPAWKRFNKVIANNGDVGIWHETYEITPEKFESIYVNMPKFGLAKAMQHVTVTEQRDSAKMRMTK